MNQTKDGWQGFIDLCRETKEKELLEGLLTVFLTHEEKESLAMRYLIVRELLKGERTQRDIAKKLSVSIAKITRGSNALKQIAPKLLKHLEKNCSKGS